VVAALFSNTLCRIFDRWVLSFAVVV